MSKVRKIMSNPDLSSIGIRRTDLEIVESIQAHVQSKVSGRITRTHILHLAIKAYKESLNARIREKEAVQEDVPGSGQERSNQ